VTPRQIQKEVQDGVATITLNRPEMLNAWTPTMGTELDEAFAEYDSDDEVRVIVVTGAGRAFCAGADLKEMAAGLDSYPTGHREWDFAGLVRYWIDKPLIATSRLLLSRGLPTFWARRHLATGTSEGPGYPGRRRYPSVDRTRGEEFTLCGERC